MINGILLSIVLPLALVFWILLREKSHLAASLEAELRGMKEARNQVVAEAHSLLNLRHLNFEITAIDSDSEGNEVRTFIEFFDRRGVSSPIITGRQIIQYDERRRPLKSFSEENGELKLYSSFVYGVDDTEIPTSVTYFNECGGRDVIITTHVEPRAFSLSARSTIRSDVVELTYSKLNKNDDAIESKSALAEWPRTMAQRYSDNVEDGWPYTLAELSVSFDKIFPKASTVGEQRRQGTGFQFPSSTKPALSFEIRGSRGEMTLDLRENLRSAITDLPEGRPVEREEESDLDGHEDDEEDNW